MRAYHYMFNNNVDYYPRLRERYKRAATMGRRRRGAPRPMPRLTNELHANELHDGRVRGFTGDSAAKK